VRRLKAQTPTPRGLVVSDRCELNNVSLVRRCGERCKTAERQVLGVARCYEPCAPMAEPGPKRWSRYVLAPIDGSFPDDLYIPDLKDARTLLQLTERLEKQKRSGNGCGRRGPRRL